VISIIEPVNEAHLKEGGGRQADHAEVDYKDRPVLQLNWAWAHAAPEMVELLWHE
jgi:hypothetical protein